MEFPIHMSDRSFTAVIDGSCYQTDRSNPNWESIKELIKDPTAKAEALIALIQPITAISNALVGRQDVRVVGGEVYYGDELVRTSLALRILDILNEGLPIEPWVRFMENLYANPWTEAREELYTWLEHGNMPITPDGCFLAYKVVKGTYLDCHSGQFDNHVGQIVVMPGGRSAVDSSRWQACSVGLHFCSLGYISGFWSAGNKCMLIKVNPADVVTIPSNETAKGRCWRYEVVGEIAREQVDTVAWKPIAGSHDEYDWDEQGDTGTADSEPFVETTALGRVTRSHFEQLLAQNDGSLAALGRSVGVPAGTVGGWKKKLGVS